MFQGIQAVALPLVQEFGYSKEIEDRVLAPLPTKLVGIQKIVTGMLQGLIAAAFVFPIAAIVPATPVHLHIHWLVLITLAPLAGWVAAALGLVLGTKVQPQYVSYLFALVVLPMTFLGAIYYPWTTLAAVRWLQIVVLVNPLVYMCEGFRAALTTGVPHMALPYVYGALLLLRRRAHLDRHRRLPTPHHQLERLPDPSRRGFAVRGGAAREPIAGRSAAEPGNETPAGQRRRPALPCAAGPPEHRLSSGASRSRAKRSGARRRNPSRSAAASGFAVRRRAAGAPIVERSE